MLKLFSSEFHICNKMSKDNFIYNNNHLSFPVGHFVIVNFIEAFDQWITQEVFLIKR